MTLSGQEFISRQHLTDHLAGRGPVIALLDAASLPGLPERIESRQVEALSLFMGAKAEELRDVAPYLVRLDLNGVFMRDFLNNGQLPWAMWSKRPGLLLLSNLDLKALQKHFRRFLRVQADGNTFFFRFWEPASAIAYFNASAASNDRARWFFPREGGQIDALLVPDLPRDRLCIYTAGPQPQKPVWGNTPFTLQPAELEAMRATRIEQNLQQMVTMMVQAFPDIATKLPPADLNQAVRQSVSRSTELGIHQRKNAFRIAAWDLHSGGRFEDTDPGGSLRHILTASLDETEKMRRLAERIVQLGPANT